MKTRTRRQEWTAGFDPLAARLADGDPLAPKALVERHYRELYRYAFSVLREERSAEDAVQDAFERAFSALGRYSEERLRAMRLRPWMYKITLNVARNRLRRRREVSVEEPSVAGGAASDQDGDEREIHGARRRTRDRVAARDCGAHRAGQGAGRADRRRGGRGDRLLLRRGVAARACVRGGGA